MKPIEGSDGFACLYCHRMAIYEADDGDELCSDHAKRYRNKEYKEMKERENAQTSSKDPTEGSS